MLCQCAGFAAVGVPSSLSNLGSNTGNFKMLGPWNPLPFFLTEPVCENEMKLNDEGYG